MDIWLICVLIVVYLAIGLGLAKFLASVQLIDTTTQIGVTALAWPIVLLAAFMIVVSLVIIAIIFGVIEPIFEPIFDLLGKWIAKIIHAEVVPTKDW